MLQTSLHATPKLTSPNRAAVADKLLPLCNQLSTRNFFAVQSSSPLCSPLSFAAAIQFLINVFEKSFKTKSGKSISMLILNYLCIQNKA